MTLTDEVKAIEILEGVPVSFRDRQWYAVKMQLLENAVEKNEKVKRDIIAGEYRKKLEILSDDVKRKYGDKALKEEDLLPDA